MYLAGQYLSSRVTNVVFSMFNKEAPNGLTERINRTD